MHSKPSGLSRLIILGLVVLSFPSIPLITARSDRSSGDKSSEKVDAIFSQWSKPDSPGCALSVIKDGQVIFKRGYGMANLDHGIPLSSKSVFNIASVSKQFTAMSIALLATQGQLTEFAGAYYSNEIEATYNIILLGDKLVLRRKNVDGETPVIAQFADAFSVAGTGSIRFTRDMQNHVSGFLLSTGRVRRLRFDKR